jgi:Tol biopolymer transport system component
MKQISKSSVIFLLITILCLSQFSCSKDDNPVDPSERDLPPLEDEIPYDFLGSGKILFERVGPYPGEYEGFYIIDIDNRKTWGMGIQSSSDPCLSIDGNKIAFTHSNGSDTFYDIYTMNLDGSNMKRVTNLGGQERCPSWSPYNDKIVFWISNSPDYIYTVDVSNSKLTLVQELKNYQAQPSTYIPSGRMSVTNNSRTVYASNSYWDENNTGGLFIINPTSGFFKVLLHSPQDVYYESPRFSPDEKSIVYLSVTRDQNWEYDSLGINMLDLASESVEVIYQSKIQGKEWSDPSIINSIWICWSPDGSKLLFSKPVADFTSYLYAINKDGTGLIQVTSLEGVTDRDLSWSN